MAYQAEHAYTDNLRITNCIPIATIDLNSILIDLFLCSKLRKTQLSRLNLAFDDSDNSWRNKCERLNETNCAYIEEAL